MLNCLKCRQVSEELEAVDIINLYEVTSTNTTDAHAELRLFLQNGGDPNSTVISENGFRSILSHALKNNNFEAVKMLCEFGANPNFKHDDEFPVLVQVLLNSLRKGDAFMTDQLFDDIIECVVNAGADRKSTR